MKTIFHFVNTSVKNIPLHLFFFTEKNNADYFL